MSVSLGMAYRMTKGPTMGFTVGFVLGFAFACAIPASALAVIGLTQLLDKRAERKEVRRIVEHVLQEASHP